MTPDTAPMPPEISAAGKEAVTKPRIALMGEFSAGKSTLANLLLEHPFSPVQATATQVPPVWYRHGSGQCQRVTLSGETVAVAGNDWQTATAKDTQMVFLERKAEILEAADIIDMPGISDPNLAIQYGEVMLPLVDIVIWCTPSNQAWRQSEAALWSEVDPQIQARSLLLVTRMDQVRAEIDQARILHRVSHEAGSEFAAVLPISLTQALAAGDDEDALEACGAADMVRFLIRTLQTLEDAPRPAFKPLTLPAPNTAAAAPERPDVKPSLPRRVVPRRIGRPVRRPA